MSKPVILFLGLLALAAAGPTDDDAKLNRGEQVRGVLLDALEQSYQNGGVWPDRLPSTELIYSRPAKSTNVNKIDATVVLHEPIDQHPDGVWVGYADGHLEFAPTAADLAACENQLPLIPDPIVPSAMIGPAAGDLTLKITDPDGQPVAGAMVGAFGQFGDTYPTEPRVFFSYAADNKRVDKPVISDAEGLATIPAASVFDPNSPFRFSQDESAPLYVLQEQRGLVALEEIERREFGAAGVRRVRLQPACEVTGDVTSLGLHRVGLGLPHVHSYAARAEQRITFGIAGDFNSPQFRLLLPPGDFKIAADGTMCDYALRYLHIQPGRRQLQLHIDIPSYYFAEMFGQFPPELRGIKAWKNGGPVTLQQLRGKVVLLDFWGYWCGPCISNMPDLMRLNDDFADKGLVIIAVHDDSVDSIAEMDQKLAADRQKFWGGRDLPFLVALDGGGETRITYSQLTVRGTTTAAYGILQYPTALLIGRDGRLDARVLAGTPEARQEIQKLLDAK
jgi:thiol-disulfide isomerase/thioredoxin